MRPQVRMTPITIKEYALIFSSLPTTILVLIAVAIPPFGSGATDFVSTALGAICANGVPTFWCRVPKPIPSLAVVQLANYVVFILVSGYFGFWIWGGKYKKPANYQQGAASIGYQAGWTFLWFIMIFGGQVFSQRISPWSGIGLVFAIVALSAALFCFRMLAISLRFR